MSLPTPGTPEEPAPERLPEAGSAERWWLPKTLGGRIYLLVVALGAAGLLVVAFGPWRRGVALLGAGLVLGGVLRLVLPQRQAGMLRVRGWRGTDVVMLAGVGAALIVLALVIPNQPPG